MLYGHWEGRRRHHDEISPTIPFTQQIPAHIIQEREYFLQLSFHNFGVTVNCLIFNLRMVFGRRS